MKQDMKREILIAIFGLISRLRHGSLICVIALALQPIPCSSPSGPTSATLLRDETNNFYTNKLQAREISCCKGVIFIL